MRQNDYKMIEEVKKKKTSTVKLLLPMYKENKETV